MYEERSRARWHEHGEKNSKYFLNLENRNHIRKHVIRSDPFEILQAEKEFYESLYKSRRDGMQRNEAYFNYEELPIPKLSEECKQLGE